MTKPKEITKIDTSTIEQDVYSSLAYFDIFSHPLRTQEILEFTQQHSNQADVSTALATLVSAGIVEKQEEYYSLAESNIDTSKRIANEDRANAAMDDAMHYGKKIAGFPFVMAVSISGSMSKGVLHEDGDYDFFLIIKRRKIWLAKLILKLYKVVFLGNSYEYFCINYLISDEKLEIEEKNLFTATELTTIIPVSGEVQLFNQLKEANKWVADYLPNKNWRNYTEHLPTKRGISRLLQVALDNRLGMALDRMIMSLTVYRNKAKYEGLVDSSLFDIAFKSTEHVAKVHPGNTQQYVLKSLEEKIEKYKCQS